MRFKLFKKQIFNNLKNFYLKNLTIKKIAQQKLSYFYKLIDEYKRKRMMLKLENKF